MSPIRHDTSTPLKAAKPRPVTLNDTTEPSSQPQFKPSMSSDTTQPSSRTQFKPSMSSDTTQPSSQPQPKPIMFIATSDDKTQPSSQFQPRVVTSNSKMKECLGLDLTDKKILLSSTEWLNDNIVNAAQKLLKKVNPAMSGLQNVNLGLTMSFNVEPGEFIQILNDGCSHWLTVSTVALKHPEVHAFDSLYTSTSTKMQISNILYSDKPTITVSFKDVQMQSGFSDCGLFSIAFATALIFGRQPGEFMFQQREMRSHLIQCLESRLMSMFPILGLRRVTRKVKSTDEVDIYWICRIPEFTNSQWIQCSACKEWYHSNVCVKVDEKYLNSKLAYYCFRCNNN